MSSNLTGRAIFIGSGPRTLPQHPSTRAGADRSEDAALEKARFGGLEIEEKPKMPR